MFAGSILKIPALCYDLIITELPAMKMPPSPVIKPTDIKSKSPEMMMTLSACRINEKFTAKGTFFSSG